MRWIWWLAGVLILAVGVGAFFMLRGPSVDLDHPPQFIQADFIDLAHVATVSKFRSGAGHDFSSGGESCRSMKHYYHLLYDEATEGYRQGHDGYPPPPNGLTDIEITSPVEGTVIEVESERTHQFGSQLYIRPNQAKNFTVRLFHIYPKEGIGKGSTLTAGQKIGVIGAGQATDIAVQRGGFSGDFVSYFDVMPDSIFATYQARGISSRDELIISKEARDANPLTCDGEQFAHPASYDQNQDLVTLSSTGTTTLPPEPPTGTLDHGLPPNDADAGFPPAPASSSTDEPPLLLKSIGVELGTYDPATNRAGDFEFTKQKLQFNRLFMGYGFHIPAEQSGNGAKDNPQPTFILPLGTKVRSLVDGVVADIPTVWSGDYSIHVTDGKNEQWRYETEHVINPVVKVGDHVTTGQVVAEVSDYDTSLPAGFGLFEIGILHVGQTPEHVCPFAYLAPSIKADIQSKILQFYKDWEAYRGKDSLYDESESPIGCITTGPIEG